MALVSGSWLVDSLLLIASLMFLLYRYLTSAYSYFQTQGIPYLNPDLLLGLKTIFNKPQMDLAQFLYNSFPGERFFGYFQIMVPTVLLKDPELVQRIMIKDFAYFHDRGFPIIESDKLISNNLFHIKGPTWRTLRNKLTPTFTSGKIKLMFNQFLKTGDNLLKSLDKSATSSEVLEAKSISMEYSTEVIASTAFGLDFGKKNPQTAEFVDRATTAFDPNITQIIAFFFGLIAPNVLNKLGQMFRLSLAKKGTAEYFTNLTNATKEFRTKNNIKRNDYFQLLMTLQEAEESGKVSTLQTDDINEEDALINQMEYAPHVTQTKTETKLITDDFITAQAFVFLLAGTDSVSGTLSFALYHIAKDENVQERLVKEVDSTLTQHKSWTYQAVKEMTYLDQVIQETMRLYPVVPMTFRQCTIPYPIPDSSVVIEKGTIVAIPVAGLHMDPKVFPDPGKFDPERFANNNHKPKPNYLPFGDGPRICIAMRFAVVEMKVCLAKIISQYSMEVNSKTQEPFVFEQKSFSPKPVGGIWLNFKKRQHLMNQLPDETQTKHTETQ